MKRKTQVLELAWRLRRAAELKGKDLTSEEEKVARMIIEFVYRWIPRDPARALDFRAELKDLLDSYSDAMNKDNDKIEPGGPVPV
jgi:hypothetical protein